VAIIRRTLSRSEPFFNLLVGLEQKGLNSCACFSASAYFYASIQGKELAGTGASFSMVWPIPSSVMRNGVDEPRETPPGWAGGLRKASTC